MAKQAAGNDAAKALAEGRGVLEAAARCLQAVAAGLDQRFVLAVDEIAGCRGMLVLTGIGKAGHVAQKISATFASTGTPSIYIHPTDAVHGDVGRVGGQDVVLALSNSGASQEIVRLLPTIRSIGARILALCAEPESPLAREADVCLCFGRHDEAGAHGLAPTTSTTAMLALGDALAMAVAARRDFSPAEFARFHPGGALGRSLMRVEDVMRKGDANPVIGEDRPLREALHVMTTTVGRPGAVSVVDGSGALVGFYTDGDFRRAIDAASASGRFDMLERPIAEFMTRNPRAVGPDKLAAEAMRMLREARIDQLPVVDEDRRAVGFLDVQDLLDVRVLP